MEFTLIMIDELGNEVTGDTYTLGSGLDEDYIELWKQIKINKAFKRYPEAQGFYFEDRSDWKRAVDWMIYNDDPNVDFDDVLYAKPWECEDFDDNF